MIELTGRRRYVPITPRQSSPRYVMALQLEYCEYNEAASRWELKWRFATDMDVRDTAGVPVTGGAE